MDAHLYVEPTDVQYEGASVGFWGFPEQRIPAGGFIKLIVPDDIIAYTTGLTCLDVSITDTHSYILLTTRFVVNIGD